MGQNRKHIDDLFKEALGNYTETPPPAAWDALEKRLGGLPPAAPRSPYRWLHYLITGSAIVVLGVLVTKKIGNNLYIGNKNISSAKTVIAVTKHKSSANTNLSKIHSDHIPHSAITVAQEKEGNAQLSAINNNSIAVNNISQQTNKRLSEGKSNDTQPSANGSAQSNNLYSKNIKTLGKPAANSRSTKEVGTIANNNNSSNHSVKKSKTNNLNNTGKTTTPPNDNYNSSNPTEKEASNKTKVGAAIAAAPDLPGASKKTVPDSLKKQNINLLKKESNTKTLSAASFRKYEVGVKAGYEGGGNNAAKKIIVSSYIQYMVSSKLSFMLQPAVKYSHTSNYKLNGTQSFYKANNDSAAKISSMVPVYGTGSDTIGYMETITYSQTHDSIIKSYTSGGTYMEFELPVLLKYKVSDKCSFYGGFTMTYSTNIGITEHTYTSAPILKTVTIQPEFVENGATPVIAPVSSVINYSGTPISNYQGPLYTSPSGGLFRLGYMLGFNYEYNQKWLLDVLIQQAPAKASPVGGYNTNAPLSATYFRIMLGYKIF